ncbi:MAG: hypothetical protein IJU76_08145 [Desulfovibrionaceae bacterium]|nr:hypothetical protein [Desulfovibrionaceae bacterium]
MSHYAFINKRFPARNFKPGPKSDCLQLCGKHTYTLRDCIIDATGLEDGCVDEACGITRGASATFDHCLFRNAKKLVLLGSGDKERRLDEDGKTVIFRNCWFDNFGRRGPEVQCGMICTMDGCLITDWGGGDRFDTRAFGAWVHDGAVLEIKNSVFMQNVKPSLKTWFLDHVKHIGQACNDHGIGALFKRRTYVSGFKRACTYDHDDLCDVIMSNCYVQDGLVADNNLSPMSETEAFKLYAEMHNYFDALIVNTATSDWSPKG